MQENICMEGIERRGRVYYMRLRVPARFAEVEPRVEINKSLKTRDYDEAKVRLGVRKRAIFSEWEARLARQQGEDTPEAFEAAIAMLVEIGVPYRPMEDLLAGPINDLLDRIERLDRTAPESVEVPAALGALEFPRVLVSEMPPIIEEVERASVASTNDRQIRAWRTKYTHAAKSFSSIVRDKAILEITEQDAIAYRKHWKVRRDNGEITTNHAVKRLRFMRQLVDAYFERFDVPPSQRINPFGGLRIDKVAADESEAIRKLALPAPWVQRVIIDQQGLDGLNIEARDIAIVAAECGSRQTEIIDLPPEDIRLRHAIPHLQLRVVSGGAFKRQLKNSASKRPVVLLGAALEAMWRNANGFPRYRGKASYPAAVNNYMRDNNLFPDLPEDETGKYTIGCTRHTFEDRMVHAKMSNEERAYLMGHSIGKVRGRPVYGSEPDLRMRALYQEMVSFPTERWKPRPISVLRREIDNLAKSLGFRVE